MSSEDKHISRRDAVHIRSQIKGGDCDTMPSELSRHQKWNMLTTTRIVSSVEKWRQHQHCETSSVRITDRWEESVTHVDRQRPDFLVVKCKRGGDMLNTLNAVTDRVKLQWSKFPGKCIYPVITLSVHSRNQTWQKTTFGRHTKSVV